MIALIRKNLRLWGYGKSLALFTGCILFSISGRLNGGIAYERHILSAVSDHYYLTYFVLPIVLLSCFSFIDDDGEPVILRFQSYHSYFLKKWIGVGLIAVILTAVQTGAILLSGIGLPLGNEWNLAAGATEAELFSTLEQLFASPLQAFVCFTLYQLIGSWLIFGICMWIGHFTGRKWTIRIVIVLYVLSAVWIKLPAIQNIPLTSFNHCADDRRNALCVDTVLRASFFGLCQLQFCSADHHRRLCQRRRCADRSDSDTDSCVELH